MSHSYHVSPPVGTASGVVFASPHSGRVYPPDLLDATDLDERAIRSSEDAFVDLLFEQSAEFGATFLRANMARAYVDLNRAAEELDPAIVHDLKGGRHNPRVASGLGVIPRVVANGRVIYTGKMPKAEAIGRLDRVWRPYHAVLQDLLEQARAEFGQAILIDCHSMPHEAVNPRALPRSRVPEIVIGDRFGASAHSEIVDAVEAAFVRAGFRVARNAPFAGAYTTLQYGRPTRQQHAVQIEIDRSLYMDEAAIVPHSGFDGFKLRLRDVIRDIAQITTRTKKMAAE